MWLTRFLASLGKVMLASLITGTVLAMMNITTRDIFPGAAATLDQITDTIELALNWLIIWSLPNIMVGAIIIVPVWLILVVFGPKNT